MPWAAENNVLLYGLNSNAELGIRLNPAPLTLILILPPSQPNSVANQWSTETRGTGVSAGIRMGGLSSVRAPVTSSNSQSSPASRSATKAACPGRLSGRLSTTAQSGVSKLAAVSCVPTVQSSRPVSQSVSEILLRSPCPMQSPGGSGSRTIGRASAWACFAGALAAALRSGLRRPRSDDSAQSMLPIVKKAHRQT